MMSMATGSALKPSEIPQVSLTRLPSTLCFGHRETGASKFHRWQNIRLQHSGIIIGRHFQPISRLLNHSDNANDHLTKAQPHQAGDSRDIGTQFHGKSLKNMLDSFYRLSRAYTLKGVVLSIVSVSLLAIEKLSDFTPLFSLGFLQAIVGGCLSNLYIVGINQLSDIEIDKVNKPYLPLASGEFSKKTIMLLTSLYVVLAFLLGWSVKSWPLKLGMFLWLAFGTVYSVNLPFMRWKRVPVLAALCIWSLMGAIIPILFHLHAQTYINGRSLVLSKHAIFVAGIMSIYGIVLAIFKDIPDVEGDRINGIQTFAMQLGQKRVFWFCIWLLELAYVAAILIGLSSSHAWIKFIMALGHSILGFILWKKAKLVDPQCNEATESFYLFIWKLYYAEYLMVPLLRF